jgi:ketosteroid isomerase-like protein
MKKMNILVVAVFLLVMPILAVAQEDKRPNEAAIRQTVQYYIDGFRNNDAESLRKAFHPKARLFSQSNQRCPGKTELMATTAEQFSANVKRFGHRPEPKAVISTILSVDTAGDTAVVKAEWYWADSWWGCGKISLLNPPPGVTTTDYLSLVRFDSGWKIVGKVSSTREGR